MNDTKYDTDSQPKEAMEVSPPKRTRKTRPRRGAAAVEMKTRGLNAHEIARATSVPQTTVKGILDKYSKVFKALPKVAEFQQIKADLLDAEKLTALETAVSQSKLNKASFLALVTGAEKLHKMSRLERNQSTDNVAHKHFGSLTLTPDMEDPE